MTLRCIFAFTVLNVFSGAMKSQEPQNHYLVKFHTVRASSIDEMKSVLSKLTGATTLSYVPEDSTFMLGTSRLLNKDVISGKLQKHYFPVTSITHLETDIDPFPVMRNSGNMDADAIQYEKEKQAWVKKYPAAYKKMLDKK